MNKKIAAGIMDLAYVIAAFATGSAGRTLWIRKERSL